MELDGNDLGSNDPFNSNAFTQAFDRANNEASTPSSQNPQPSLGAPGQPTQPTAPQQPLAPATFPPASQQASAPGNFAHGQTAPQAQSVQPVSVSPQLSALVQSARAAGIQVADTATEGEIASALLRQMQQQQTYAEVGRSVLPHLGAFQRFVASQGSQQQPSTPAAPETFDPEAYFAEKWGTPKWDHAYDLAIQNNLVQRDPETGLYKPSPGCELLAANVVQGLNDAAMAQHQRWQELVRGNPLKYFHENLREPFQKAWQEDMDRRFAEYEERQRQQQLIQQYEEQNKDWIYSNGQPTTSGARLFEIIGDLRSSGVTDTSTLFRLAERMLQAEISSVQQQQAPMAAAQQATPQVQTQAPAPQPAQQVTPQVASRQAQDSFLQNAQRASHTPQAGAYAVQSNQYQPSSLGRQDIESMFTRRFEALHGQPG